MTKFQKFKLAEQLLNIRCKVNRINQGGCGVFALNLLFRLRELGFNPKIKVLKTNRSNYRNTNQIKFNFNIGYIHGFSHVYLQVDNVFIDANGVYDKDKYEYADGIEFHKIRGFISEDILVQATNEPGCWNNSFNKRQIPNMIKLINKINI